MLWKCSIIFYKNDALSYFNRFPRPIFSYINKVIEDKAKEIPCRAVLSGAAND
jgi:hypothetical protein